MRGEIAAPLFLFVVAILALAFSTPAPREGCAASSRSTSRPAGERAPDATTADHLQGAHPDNPQHVPIVPARARTGTRDPWASSTRLRQVADENVPKGPGRSTGEKWAVKVLLESDWQSEAFRERFMREAEICSHLSHPRYRQGARLGGCTAGPPPATPTRHSRSSSWSGWRGDDLRDRMRMCPDGRMPVGQGGILRRGDPAGAEGRARRRHRAPGSQAGEHPHHALRTREGHGLRHRPATSCDST